MQYRGYVHFKYVYSGRKWIISKFQHLQSQSLTKFSVELACALVLLLITIAKLPKLDMRAYFVVSERMVLCLRRRCFSLCKELGRSYFPEEPGSKLVYQTCILNNDEFMDFMKIILENQFPFWLIINNTTNQCIVSAKLKNTHITSEPLNFNIQPNYHA